MFGAECLRVDVNVETVAVCMDMSEYIKEYSEQSDSQKKNTTEE